MRIAVFPSLDQAALAGLALLGTPIYIYSYATQQVVWSNAPGLQFWDMPSVEGMAQRAWPADDTQSSARLKIFLEAFRRGETKTGSWIFHVNGVAASVIMRCQGVSLDGHPEAMLVELRPLGTENLPVADLRAMEFMRHTPSLVTYLSEAGDVLWQNNAAIRFFAQFDSANRTSAETVRAAFANPDEFASMMREAAEVGEAEAVFERTVAINLAPGTVHTVRMRYMTDPGTGKPATMIFQRDVSVLQDVKGQPAASEAALDIVFGLSTVPSLLICPSGDELLRANFAAAKMLGLESADFGGPAKFVVEADAAANFIATVNATGTCSQSMLLKTNCGRTFWAAVSGTKLAYAQNDAILVVIQDIDQDHQHTIELETALDYQRGVSDLRRNLLEIAAHDLRTPLAVIDGAAQRIARRADQFTPDMLVETANRIRRFVTRLNDLLDATIEQARADSASVSCARQPGFIQDTISEVAAAFSERAEIAIAEQVQRLPEVWFDHAEIERALLNVLENAVKYADGDARIEIGGEVRNDLLTIFIRDFGIGVPPDQREQVFAERARGANVGNRPGNGLGLYIVRAIARAHGGDASVVETQGQGTTLRLMLPLREGAVPESPPNPEGSMFATSARQG